MGKVKGKFDAILRADISEDRSHGFILIQAALRRGRAGDALDVQRPTPRHPDTRLSRPSISVVLERQDALI